MAFQIKDFASITAGAINWIRATTQRITDFNVGSVIRTMIEACAVEIEELYQRMFIGIREAIPVSVYNSFDFAALPAVASSGLVRVTIAAATADVLIPTGTKFSVAGRSVFYTATGDVVIAAGNTMGDVSVVASEDGSSGNLPSGAIFDVQPAPTNFVGATNLADFINGRDLENDADRKIRFNEFIASLNRGTVRALQYGAKNFAKLYDSAGHLIERVQFVNVVEPYELDVTQPTGLVLMYIHNGVGSTSPALVAKTKDVMYGYTDPVTQEVVPGWKAAGVVVTVIACTEQLVNVYGVITEVPGYDHDTVAAAAGDLITQYLLGLDIGESAIAAKIIELAMSVEGVYNFHLSSPAADVVPSSSTKVMPGYVALTNAVIVPYTGSLALTPRLVTRTP